MKKTPRDFSLGGEVRILNWTIAIECFDGMFCAYPYVLYLVQVLLGEFYPQLHQEY